MGVEGYRWTIEASGSEWLWLIRSRDGGAPLLSGGAPSRAQAAACVVRALIVGVTEDRQQHLAA